VDAGLKTVKSISVLRNLVSVPGDISVVVINVGIIIAHLLSCVVDAMLEGSDRLTNSFSANEHVASLGNLKLVSVFTEQGTVSVESIDSFVEIGSSGVGRGCSAITAIVLVSGIVVIVVIIENWFLMTMTMTTVNFFAGKSGNS